MGNLDLVIIINGMALFIKGEDYKGRWHALEIAREKYLEKVKKDYIAAVEADALDRDSDYWYMEPKEIKIIEITPL